MNRWITRSPVLCCLFRASKRRKLTIIIVGLSEIAAPSAMKHYAEAHTMPAVMIRELRRAITRERMRAALGSIYITKTSCCTAAYLRVIDVDVHAHTMRTLHSRVRRQHPERTTSPAMRGSKQVAAVASCRRPAHKLPAGRVLFHPSQRSNRQKATHPGRSRRSGRPLKGTIARIT